MRLDRVFRWLNNTNLLIIIGILICSAHLTLLLRADHVSTSIAALLVWMAMAVLLNDFSSLSVSGNYHSFHSSTTTGSRLTQAIGIGATLWALLVLTFPTRLYDPLLVFVPAAAGGGIAFLLGMKLKSHTMRDIIIIGALLPCNEFISRILPEQKIVFGTAKLACLGLNVIGKYCRSQNELIIMKQQIISVDPPCAGIETLTLCILCTITFIILFPIKRNGCWLAALILLTIVIAFTTNTVRVIILSISSKECDLTWWKSYCGFDFWHTGPGSHIFILFAVGLVCALWWWDIEQNTQAKKQN